MILEETGVEASDAEKEICESRIDAQNFPTGFAGADSIVSNAAVLSSKSTTTSERHLKKFFSSSQEIAQASRFGELESPLSSIRIRPTNAFRLPSLTMKIEIRNHDKRFLRRIVKQ